MPRRQQNFEGKKEHKEQWKFTVGKRRPHDDIVHNSSPDRGSSSDSSAGSSAGGLGNEDNLAEALVGLMLGATLAGNLHESKSPGHGPGPGHDNFSMMIPKTNEGRNLGSPLSSDARYCDEIVSQVKNNSDIQKNEMIRSRENAKENAEFIVTEMKKCFEELKDELRQIFIHPLNQQQQQAGVSVAAPTQNQDK